MTADVPFWDIQRDAKDVELAGLVAIEDEVQRQHAARMGIPARFLGYPVMPAPTTPEQALEASIALATFGNVLLEPATLVRSAAWVNAHPELRPKPYREALRLESVSWLVLHGGDFAFNAGRT